MEATSNTDDKGIRLTKGTVPIPTDLLDRVMPTLRDTELRVLLVVVRQTLGWQVGKDPYLRKERDWLTQSQLKRRTGRASGAVARAIDALVQKKLIQVLDQNEGLLDTPAKRRRCLGRIYYRMHKQCIETVSNKANSKEVESEHAKSHTTKQSRYKNRGYSRPNVDKSVEKPVLIKNRSWDRAKDIIFEQRWKEVEVQATDT